MELRIFGKHVAEDDFLHQFLTEVKEEDQVWGFVALRVDGNLNNRDC